MKTLQELIAGVRDCEAQGEAWTDKNKGCFATNASNRYEGFRSGHSAACSVLVPALKVAIDELELCAEDSENCEGIRACKEALTEIRSLLTQKEGE